MYEAELSIISNARNELYKLDTPVIALIALVVLSIVFLPMLSPVFGLASFIYLYLKLVKVARMPCPQCAMAFGTSALVVLGPGADRCENCGLSLN